MFEKFIQSTLGQNLQALRKYLRYNSHPYMAVSSRFKIVSYFNQWTSLKKSERTAISEQLPWINFEGIDFLKTILKSDMKVFEYGTGGSSLFFSKNVMMVVGVEHDELWFQRVREALNSHGINNCQSILCPPESLPEAIESPNYSDPNQYLSSDEKYLNRYSFFKYASSIDKFENSYFDIVSADGRARPSCIKHALPKIKRGGYLLIDNSDRDYYVSMLSNELQQFEKVFEKFGPGPFNEIFWGTTFYMKIG